MPPSPGLGSILVVDDDSELREGLCDVLADEGYGTTSASDGADALVQLEAAPLPDVVLLDLRMPGMDGFEFLERRQADPKLKDVPVIVITATPDPMRMSFPIVTTLLKPVNLLVLLPLLSAYTIR